MSQYLKNYNEWLVKATDEVIQNELRSIADDEKEIENRFYKELEFGTGGLRGVLGAGTNYLNIYTIRKITKGLADYVLKNGGKSVAISYDSRINSKLFAENTAMVLASLGLKAHLSKELMPTPFLSYAVRSLKADAGVMITASHNPCKYNGYKVYGNDGCQLTDTDADIVSKFIEQSDGFDLRLKTFDEYLAENKIEFICDCVEENYLKDVTSQSENTCDGIKVMYTALNGAGYRLVPKVLKLQKNTDLEVVPEQAYPEGNFTTCSYPNPEKKEALKLGLELAEQKGSDILVATDPDADRVGIAVKTHGGFKLLSGNETGILLANYLLTVKKEKGKLPARPVVIKTIVTTSIINPIAKSFDVEVRDVLTGFKYIGEQIGLLEKDNESDRFILGFEESYGYLAGSYVRDKDAVVASMLVVEMASYYKKQNLTLVDVLNTLYSKYGKYSHRLVSKEFAGATGNKRMKELLNSIRENQPEDINGLKILKVTDYLTQTEKDLPKSNVLVYDLEDNAQLIIRPSGTEPLIKFYLTSALATDALNEGIFKKQTDFIDQFFN